MHWFVLIFTVDLLKKSPRFKYAGSRNKKRHWKCEWVQNQGPKSPKPFKSFFTPKQIIERKSRAKLSLDWESEREKMWCRKKRSQEDEETRWDTEKQWQRSSNTPKRRRFRRRNRTREAHYGRWRRGRRAGQTSGSRTLLPSSMSSWLCSWARPKSPDWSPSTKT